MNWRLNTFADYAHVVAGLIVVLFLVFGATWNIKVLDWQAIGSIVAAIGLLVAAVAASHAAAAARATLQVDEQQATRAESARNLRASSVATVFFHEVSRASQLATTLQLQAISVRDAGAKQALDTLIEGIQHLRMPQIERFIDRFVDFDLATAETLVRCVGLYASISVRRPPDDTYEPLPGEIVGAYTSLLGSVNVFANTTSSAAELLKPYLEAAVAAHRERNARVQAAANPAQA